jgi:ribosome-binding protein aMBF1 (putative translation factor)
MNKKIKAIDFQNHLKGELKNQKFKKYYKEHEKQLEIAYQIACMRKVVKMSQSELAKKIGTQQSNIARIESGQQNITIGRLYKITNALGCDFKIQLTK